MMHKVARKVMAKSVNATAARTITVAAKSNIFSRAYDRISGKSALQSEKADIEMLENFTKLTMSLSQIIIPQSHPLNDLAEKIKALHSINESNTAVKDILMALENYRSFITAQNEPYKLELCDVIPATSGENEKDFQLKWETSMRLRLLGHYLHHLKLALQEGEIKPSMFTPSTIDRVIDSSLLGTSSERLQEHMRLYGQEFNSPQLQDCFYTLYNAEVECVSTIFSELKNKHKHHKKRMDKYAKNYLLDTLELNTKTRCVFAWSDPLFTGFKPLPDEHIIPVEDLLRSRRKYFKEGTSVANNLMSTYTGERRMYYTDKLDTKETMRMGFAFFVGTCILDFIICVM